MQLATWKILMVEDDEDDFVLTRAMLSQAKTANYILDWASSYDKGWEMIRDGCYDVILMDYDLGHGNGIGLTRKAVAFDCKMPIILFTGRGSYELDLEAMQAGVTMYLTKGETSALMLERSIRYAIERKQTEESLKLANKDLERLNLSLQQELVRREQAEQELRDSEQKLRKMADTLELEKRRLSTVIDHLPVGVWIADHKGRLVGKNEQADKIWAGDAPLSESMEFYDKYTAWDSVTGKLLSAREYPVARTLTTGQPVGPLELIIRRLDGSNGRVLVSSAPLKDEEGRLTGAVGINIDITDRKKAEAYKERLLKENRQQREFLEKLIQSVPLAIAVLNGPEHRYVLTNPHQELLTRGKGNLIGRTVAEVWAEDPDQVLPILDKVYRSGLPFTAHDISFNVVRDRGPEEAFFDVSYIPLTDNNGQVEGILALAVETTDQVHLRKEFNAQNDLPKAIDEP
jgi:PAS domain-containing protein